MPKQERMGGTLRQQTAHGRDVLFLGRRRESWCGGGHFLRRFRCDSVLSAEAMAVLLFSGWIGTKAQLLRITHTSFDPTRPCTGVSRDLPAPPRTGQASESMLAAHEEDPAGYRLQILTVGPDCNSRMVLRRAAASDRTGGGASSFPARQEHCLSAAASSGGEFTQHGRLLLRAFRLPDLLPAVDPFSLETGQCRLFAWHSAALLVSPAEARTEGETVCSQRAQILKQRFETAAAKRHGKIGRASLCCSCYRRVRTRGQMGFFVVLLPLHCRRVTAPRPVYEYTCSSAGATQHGRESTVPVHRILQCSGWSAAFSSFPLCLFQQFGMRCRLVAQWLSRTMPRLGAHSSAREACSVPARP